MGSLDDLFQVATETFHTLGMGLLLNISEVITTKTTEKQTNLETDKLQGLASFTDKEWYLSIHC